MCGDGHMDCSPNTIRTRAKGGEGFEMPLIRPCECGTLVDFLACLDRDITRLAMRFEFVWSLRMPTAMVTTPPHRLIHQGHRTFPCVMALDRRTRASASSTTSRPSLSSCKTERFVRVSIEAVGFRCAPPVRSVVGSSSSPRVPFVPFVRTIAGISRLPFPCGAEDLVGRGGPDPASLWIGVRHRVGFPRVMLKVTILGVAVDAVVADAIFEHICSPSWRMIARILLTTGPSNTGISTDTSHRDTCP